MVAQFPQTTLRIDREQAQRQLQLLGYKAGDKIYLTAFFPKGDPRTKGGDRDKGRKAQHLNYAEVEAWQTQGRGVYLVVNGYGHGKEDVKLCRVIFYEHDNLSKEIQLTLWQALGMPKPTVQIDSGGKSIHNYWVIEEPIHPELWAFQESDGTWKGLQADLLHFASADTSLVNPNRVMRLAGAWYMQWDEGQEQTVAIAQSKIVGGCGKRYSYAELRGIIPRQQPQTQQRQRSQQQQDNSNDLLDFRSVEHQLPHWNEHGRKGWATFQCPVHTGDGKKHSTDHIHVNLSNGAWEAHCGCDRKLIYQTVRDMVGHKPIGRGYAGGIGGGDGSNRDYPRQKLPLREAVDKAREILNTDADELTTNIRLEEIREACSMSGYDWERKIIKPLKRNLEGDRFKLELLGLLRIDDPVERIRQQALMAPKYQMSANLILQAMQAMKQRTQVQEARALDLDELFDLEVEGLNWLIPGLLPERETIVLAGAPKAGKTLLAIDAAYAVATGESHFLGERVKHGKVLLVSTDESAKSTRAKLLNRGFRSQDKGSIKVLPTWDISQMGALEAMLEDFKPDLVVIDSLRRINKGSEISENSAEFADAIYTLKETLERYGAAGILIHHTNKDREALGVHRLRGSSAIAGAVWGVWQLDQIPKPDPNNKKKLIIDPKDPKRSLSVFARDIEGQSLTIELNPEDSSWSNLGELGEDEEVRTERETIEAKILRVLEANSHLPGLSGKEVIELIEGDFDDRSIYNQLSRMESKRLISCKPAPGDKRYKLYSLPNCHKGDELRNVTVTPKTSPPPPSPTPTEPVDDYYPENLTTYSLENSHQNSHQIVINSHQPDLKNPDDDCSTSTTMGDSEIVIKPVPEREGGGVKPKKCVTVAAPKLSHTLVSPTGLTGSNTAVVQPTPIEQTAFVEPDAPVFNNELAVGDRVHWLECPPHCASFSPFEVMSVDGDFAKLDLFEKVVPIAELRKVRGGAS